MTKYEAKIFYNKRDLHSISIVVVEISTQRRNFIPLLTTGSYLLHNNGELKTAYLKKHSDDDDWNNPFSYHFWDRWILWSRPDLQQCLDVIVNNFDIKFV